MGEVMNPHLPMTREEMAARGWKELDVLLITGDAYFDHPSHGAAVIGRVLEDAGYRVGIVARPDWRSTDDFAAMGRPALFAGVTAGAVDSLLNNFTADLSRRRNDAYAPGNKGMGRPNTATLVYANRVKEAFPGLPVIMGGIEASTRRLAYWDYHKRAMRRSILVDARADLLVFGPGEGQVVTIAHRLASGKDLAGIPGTARLVNDSDPTRGQVDLVLPDFENIAADSRLLVSQARSIERASVPGSRARISQAYREGTVICEAAAVQTTEDLDRIFALPFNREIHPLHNGPVPALETVRWSVISHRGCPGGCSFCAIGFHQGRDVVPRSPASVLAEIEQFARRPDFRGTISDVGGPTANAYGAVRINRKICDSCKRPSCFFPSICENIETDHRALMDLMESATKVPGVKRVLLASGIRHDLALKDRAFIERVATRHTGGHLKVAPEHVSPGVLKAMRKPPIGSFEEFERIFVAAGRRSGLEQYLVPYLIAAFPGCGRADADRAGVWLEKRGQRLQQVQTYIPLPGTLAAAWHAAGSTEDGDPLFVADLAERRRQKAILTGNRRRNSDRTPRTRRRTYQ